MPASASVPAWPLRRHLRALVLLAFAPMLLVGALTAGELALRLRDSQEARLAAAAHTARLALEREIESVILVLQTLALSPALDGAAPDLPAFRAQAEAAGRLLGGWVVLAPPGEAPQQAMNTRLAPGQPLPLLRPDGPLRAAMAQRRPVVRGVMEPEGGVVSVAVPVLRGGEVRGALSAPLEERRLARVLGAQAAVGEGHAAFALTRDHRVIARTPVEEGLRGTVPEALRAALEGRQAGLVRTAGLDGMDSVIAFARLPATGWVAAVREPAAEFEAAWRDPALRLLLLALALVTAGMLVAAWHARRLARPLARLAGRLAGSGPGARVAEYAELEVAVRGMEAALRREAENSARVAREAEDDRRLLSSVMQSVPDPIFVKDLALRYVLINEAGATAIGRPIEEIIGRTDTEFFAPEIAAAINRTDRTAIEAELFREQEERIVGADGREVWFLSLKGPWRDGRGEVSGLIGVARDVTGRKATEQRLARAEAAMRRIARADSMAAMSVGLAHELNQPLAAASNFLRAARRLAEGDPPAADRLLMARDAMADAAAQVVRAGEIIHRLRDFVNRGDTERRRVELGALALESVTMARASRGMDAAPVPVVMDGRTHQVMGDAVQLQQVAVNLLRNALEAVEGQSPPRVMLRLVQAGAQIRMEVEDNGPGIPPEVLDRLFEPFQSSKADGMGVGLSICRAIVEAHDGTLEALPAEGGGTVMRVTLPAALRVG
ncbi:ATP-binding protein [Roseococcus sp. DSY-14]|uniref:ATP-binding protein n=1 Tax=Roseococcus sp. DSY-14 TaxID=3369650 RepID=UPI00387AC86A